MRILLLSVPLLFAAAAPAAAQDEARFAGAWEGVARAGDAAALAVTLARADGGWRGTLTLARLGLADVPLDSVSVRGDSVWMWLPAAAGVVLRGRIRARGDVIEGVGTGGPPGLTFRLARPGSAQAAEVRAATAAIAYATPDSARIVTEDVPRFWAAVDASTPETRAEVLQRVYLDAGTPGLQDFVAKRIESAARLAAAYDGAPRYYASARASTLRLGEMEPAIRQAFARLEALYPDAVFPDVYFVVGRLSTGGVTSGRGLLIGAEMYGRTAELPVDELNGWLRAVLRPAEDVVHIVAHELVHYQQDNARDTTLLAAALSEGVADFVAELVSGAHVNPAAHAWADPREAALWCEFRARMHGGGVRGWMYEGERDDGRPADLGYWMGYRIARAYHERAADKTAALREMLRIRDARAFLAASGYAERFTCPSSSGDDEP